MSETQSQKPVGMRRRTKILLGVSLGLNMLVVGAAGGMLFHNGRPDRIRDAAYGAYTRALSHEDRKAIGRALRQEAGNARQDLPKIKASFAALKKALMAETYDSELVHRLITEQQANGMQRYKIGQRLLLERLDTMTPQERREFAEHLRHRGR